MKRPRWQWIGMAAAVMIGVAALIFALRLMTQNSGPGEVGAILQGVFIVIGLQLAAVFGVIALWIAFWQVRLIRWAGIAVFSIAVVVSAVGVVWSVATNRMEARTFERGVEAAEREIDEISERYFTRLKDEQPQTAYLTRKLYEDFLIEQRAVPTPSGSLVFGGLEFRAVWFLYYWTFFDPEFTGFTTFYPGQDDCAVFTEAFGAKYNQIAPVPVFVDLCETP